MLSLRTRLLVVVLLIAVIPAALAGTWAVRWLWKDKESFVFQMASLEAGTAGREVSANLERASVQLGRIALLARDPGLHEDERRRLAEQLFRASPFQAFAAAQDGTVIFEATRRPGEGPLPDVNHAPAGGSLDVRNLTLEPGRPVVGLARLVPTEQGDSPIAAAATLAGSAVLDVAAWSGPYEVLVLDRDGRVLVGPDAVRVASRTDLSHLAPFARLREGGQGAMGYDSPGGRMLGGYAPAGPGQLGVILQVPERAIADAVQELVRQVALIGLALLVLGVVLAIWVSRSVAGPVAQLTAAAQALSRGDFGAELPPAGRDELGQLSAAFARMRTDLLERERALREAEESLVQSEKMSALGQLAAGITHEVKNPLTGIIGFAQLAREMAPEGSPLVPHLEAIEREGKRSKEILDSLMRFARKEELVLQEEDLSAVVAESIRLGLHQLQIGKVRVSTQLAEGLPRVRVNAAQLQQVFLNLMLNAMHAMLPKGGLLEITSARAPDGRVYASFKDEGSGIREEDRKKLFTPFFTTKGRGEGTGLGLSVSYGIVKDHGGEIKVFSRQGVGSVFYVYLPVAGSAAA